MLVGDTIMATWPYAAFCLGRDFGYNSDISHLIRRDLNCQIPVFSEQIMNHHGGGDYGDYLDLSIPIPYKEAVRIRIPRIH